MIKLNENNLNKNLLITLKGKKKIIMENCIRNVE